MKKLMCVLLVISLLFLCGCNGESPESFADLKLVSEYAREYYAQNTPSDSAHLTLAFSDKEWQTDEISECTNRIKKFSYIWVGENYTVFWNDEMKTYGILNAEKPYTTIKSIRTWYTSLNVKRIEKGWYEIGQLSAM